MPHVGLCSGQEVDVKCLAGARDCWEEGLPAGLDGLGHAVGKPAARPLGGSIL